MSKRSKWERYGTVMPMIDPDALELHPDSAPQAAWTDLVDPAAVPAARGVNATERARYEIERDQIAFAVRQEIAAEVRAMGIDGADRIADAILAGGKDGHSKHDH